MTTNTGPICGVWVDEAGQAHTARATADGGRACAVEPFRPFAWLQSEEAARAALVTQARNANAAQAADSGTALPPVEIERLAGGGFFGLLAHGAEAGLEEFKEFLKTVRADGTSGVDVLRPLESQFLLQQRARCYADMSFAALRRCQLDIETGSADGSFSDANKAGDRVLAIGLRCGGQNRLLVLAEESDAAEKALLEELNAAFAELDPDVIEGHNLFKFDLDFLRLRCLRYKVPCAWGRFGQEARFRNSRLKLAERWVDFPRCDLPGRAVIDTYLLIQLYDITTRELSSYGLKAAALYFGITSADGAERTYIEGNKIAQCYREDRARFCAYLEDDLRETEGLADVLLPTYFEQARAFPITLQDAALRGNSTKVDLLFLEEYYHARQACPLPSEVVPFDGGYTRSFREGVFRQVLHFDVASLYPSLLLNMGRNPYRDTLGVFIPMLTRLRDYRLKYKALARTAETEALRAEYNARQSAFKILINSFYGYLGFGGARFGDGALAAEVTRQGRELLQALIERFEALGCTLLEADTDGIYLASEEYFAQPEALLAKMADTLPPGIELEWDGRYSAMFCYKAKNYALYDGQKITLRGSALRSRGIEPFLKNLSDHLIRHLLGAEPRPTEELLAEYRQRITAGTVPVAELAKGEVLRQNPEAYERFVAEGGKPRRASAEVSLRMSPRPRMGDRVNYYIIPKQKGQASTWQRARAVEEFDPQTAPYDAKFYLDKLSDWEARYATFLTSNSSDSATALGAGTANGEDAQGQLGLF
ncbi:DNA polymerase domain-containing protein [Cephaloticoccus primus]|uniref:DNA polymerase domain-containing protein n=1 Tax=Cephaloticoccus primus TaxID=1548207 RepID=UPI000838E480|nr:DNA polymerase domain-containing protein [Cephaloticoccus primus]